MRGDVDVTGAAAIEESLAGAGKTIKALPKGAALRSRQYEAPSVAATAGLVRHRRATCRHTYP
jgi:hypothetical protein